MAVPCMKRFQVDRRRDALEFRVGGKVRCSFKSIVPRSSYFSKLRKEAEFDPVEDSSEESRTRKGFRPALLAMFDPVKVDDALHLFGIRSDSLGRQEPPLLHRDTSIN